ncbi:MAG: type IV secretion system DNA-binding domain-containing protein, partial [Planctomycetota bacterium]
RELKKRLALLMGALGQFAEPGRVTFGSTSRRRGADQPGRRSLLSVPELASLWHVPTDTVQTPSLARPAYRQLPPPVELSTGAGQIGDALIGTVDFRDDKRQVRISERDRLHTLIIGKSGVGKSTLMHNMIVNDCQTGRGVAVIDPHGDLIEDILGTMPRKRTNDVVLLDVADPDHAVTFNPLACDEPLRQPAVAESLLTTLMRVFGFDAASAPRMMHILRNTLLSLVEQPATTLLDVERMLVDKNFRNRIVNQIKDKKIQSFWTHEVANWTPRYEAEALPAILNKLGHFTAHPMVRHILDHPKGLLNIRQAMDEQKIVLISLSQGAVGGAAAALLGSLLVAEIQQAALSRCDIEKAERAPFYLYVDEYPVYVNDSFAIILAEARKYGLFLTAAQQLTQQCSETLMANMFGNVSTIACFQVAFDDAQIFADQLGEPLTAADLIQLPKYKCVVRVSLDGVPSRPFTMATLSPPDSTKATTAADVVRRVSKRRYRTGKIAA